MLYTFEYSTFPMTWPHCDVTEIGQETTSIEASWGDEAVAELCRRLALVNRQLGSIYHQSVEAPQ